MSTLTVTAKVTDKQGNSTSKTGTVTIDDVPARLLVVGASSYKPGSANRLSSAQDLDTQLAMIAGVQKPVMKFWHAYNSSLPGSFSSSAVGQCIANGWGGMLNIRDTPGRIRTPAGSAALFSFLSSVPASLPVLYLIWAHEPENDGMTTSEQAVWRADMAEFIKTVIDFGNPKIIPGSCFMGDPPLSWDLFNYVPLLRAGDQEKMIFFFDAYPKCRTGPNRTDDPGFKYDDVANWARAHGFTRLGVGESTLNNDVNLPQSHVDQWWNIKLPAWLNANPDVEVFAVYDATGPAAGTNGMIDQPGELQAVANLMRFGV